MADIEAETLRWATDRARAKIALVRARRQAIDSVGSTLIDLGKSHGLDVMTGTLDEIIQLFRDALHDDNDKPGEGLWPTQK